MKDTEVNGWPDIKREYPDPDRPGLVFIVPGGHIYLCPFDVENAQKQYDKERRE